MKPRVPAGCKCAEDWNATRRIPDICGRFIGGDPNACGSCRHARACHRKRKAIGERLDIVAIEDAIGRMESMGKALDTAVRGR